MIKKYSTIPQGQVLFRGKKSPGQIKKQLLSSWSADKDSG